MKQEAWRSAISRRSRPISRARPFSSVDAASGPVFDPEGKRIGTFNTIWRREADGRWKIVFDKGCP